MHTPYSKLKFTRNQGIIVDGTFYMGGANSPLDSMVLKDGDKAVVAILRDHFRQQMVKDGFRVKAIHPDTLGGNTIYDEINDVLFIGGIVTNSRDNMKLAAEEMALRRATGKTRVITVPLIDPGNLHGVRKITVGDDGSVVKRVEEKARFYDMDTMMAVVDGRVIIYPAATTPSALQAIQRVYKARRVSYIHNERTAVAYPFNNVSIGNVVISPFADEEVRNIFGRSGKVTVVPEDIGLPEGSFSMGQGSVRCMTNTALRTLTHR
jgi:N-dimethylarginine dimethylaminohydrolase